MYRPDQFACRPFECLMDSFYRAGAKDNNQRPGNKELQPSAKKSEWTTELTGVAWRFHCSQVSHVSAGTVL